MSRRTTPAPTTPSASSTTIATCRVCGGDFAPASGALDVCSPECARLGEDSAPGEHYPNECSECCAPAGRGKTLCEQCAQ